MIEKAKNKKKEREKLRSNLVTYLQHTLKKDCKIQRSAEISRKPPNPNKQKFELKLKGKEKRREWASNWSVRYSNIPKNSLTIAAEPRRVIISFATVLEAISTFSRSINKNRTAYGIRFSDWR